MSSEKPLNERDITIFDIAENSNFGQNVINKKYKTVLEEKLNINPIFFNIKLSNILLNRNTVKNTELNFHSTGDGFNFTNIKSELPGNTNLLISEINNQDNMTITGENFGEFLSFLRDIRYVSTEENAKNEFSFDGIVSMQQGKLFVNNSNFKSKYFNSQNVVEVKLDGGIVFMAIKAQVDSLNMSDFIKENNSPKSQLGKMLKNKILFVNNFNLNTLVDLSVGKILYKGIEIENSNFVLRLSPGILGFNKINLNKKIKGDVYFDISNKQPIVNINLELKDMNFSKHANLSKLIFDLPSLDDFYGNIILAGNKLTFEKQPVNILDFNSKIKNGVLNIQNFKINGFGGECNVSGFLDMGFNRKLNLTLNACTAETSNILQAVGNVSNIEGLIGFSSILYGEGRNVNLFDKSWIFKAQLIGSGIIVKDYGLSKLNADLFDIQENEELARTLKPKEVLFNRDNKTIFESLSGTLQHTVKNGGQFNFDISRPFINGKLVGNFNFMNGNMNIDMNANFISLSGTLQNTIPLTILSKIVGTMPDGLNIATNLNQVDEYIQSTIKSFDTHKIKSEKTNNSESKK